MKLRDLDQETLRSFMEEYYKNEATIKDIMSKYNVEGGTNFIKTITVYTDDICEICGGKIKYELKSRWGGNIKKLEDNVKICEECGHTTDRKCKCKVCAGIELEKIEKENKKKVEILKSSFSRNPVSINTLEIDEMLLLALLNNKYGKDIGLISEKEEFNNPLHNDYMVEIVGRLVNKSALAINVDKTDIKYFEIIQDNRVRYYTGYMHFYINIKEDISNIEIGELIKSKFTADDILEYWRGICLAECMDYLDLRTNIMSLDVVKDSIRNDIYNYLDDLLFEYTEGEVLCIIYRSVNSASNFKVEYGVADEKAHKAIFTNIKNHIERKYNITVYDRPYELAPTPITELLFSEVLKIDINNSLKTRICYEVFDDEDLGMDVEKILEKYKKLKDDVKELIDNNVPKEYIMRCLDISPEEYDIIAADIRDVNID